MTAKRGRNATLTIICTSTGEIDWKGWEYTIYTEEENVLGRLENARKTLFIKRVPGTRHDENLFAGLHVNNQRARE